ncbi:unnamed protein product [Brugia pahangi]|uniref:Pecanex-like protein n=1 Tax=Brugia pahangi TaxID=6280 RepID=A0A0N4T8V1_BRUPA|nr:unnamed protein product [Brugia pahangi]
MFITNNYLSISVTVTIFVVFSEGADRKSCLLSSIGSSSSSNTSPSGSPSRGSGAGRVHVDQSTQPLQPALKQTTIKKDLCRSQRSMSLGSATHESLLAAVASSSQGPKHTVDMSHAENGNFMLNRNSLREKFPNEIIRVWI